MKAEKVVLETKKAKKSRNTKRPETVRSQEKNREVVEKAETITRGNNAKERALEIITSSNNWDSPLTSTAPLLTSTGKGSP